MSKKLKFKAEASTPPKPKPTPPKLGMGPKIDVPPSGPKIQVPSGLQKEVVDYKPKASASGVRGTAAETLKAKEAAKAIRGVGSEALKARNMIPAKVNPPIRLPSSVSSGAATAAKNMTVEAEVVKAKGYLDRAKVAAMGVKETIKPGKVFQPAMKQLPAGEIKQVAKVSEAKVVQPVKETTKTVVKKLGEITKQAGRALTQKENPYRQAGRAVLKKAGIDLGAKEATSMLTKIKNFGSGTAKVVRGAKIAGRVAARVALPVAVAEGTYSGFKTLSGVAQEHLKAESALADLDNQARSLAKKTGVKVTRPALTLRDKVAMTVIPGYDAPASDIKIHDSSSDPFAGRSRKKRR